VKGESPTEPTRTRAAPAVPTHPNAARARANGELPHAPLGLRSLAARYGVAALECFSSGGAGGEGLADNDIVLAAACGGGPARRARGLDARRHRGQGERHRHRPLPAAQVGSPAAPHVAATFPLIVWVLALGNAD
jgi:hypothetical protein